jgi:DtxR family Mn-dependent transcriptional regulator
LYKLNDGKAQFISTNELANYFNVAPASVSEMLKKLNLKKYIIYQPYQGAYLSESGNIIAIRLIRKHRLWEFFLCEKLGFNWSEVHEIAEELEHINSDELIKKLDNYLGKPKYDPHGDPIPDEKGIMRSLKLIPLSKLKKDDKATIKAVCNQNKSFLEYLESQEMQLGSSWTVTSINTFDGSVVIENKAAKKIFLSNKMCENILMLKNK